MPVDYEYFYGPESESFSFYRVPRLLVTGEEYRQVSVELRYASGPHGTVGPERLV